MIVKAIKNVSPLICAFPGALPEDKSVVNIKRKQKRKFAEIHVDIDNDEIQFSGESAEDPKDKFFKYAIGIIDKETGTMSVAEAPFIAMESRVSRLVNLNTDLGIDKRVSESNRRDLGETFGTNKARKAVKNYEKGQINVDIISSSVVTEISQAIDEKAKTMSTQQEVIKQSESARLIPPYDDQTSEVDQIYKISDLISGKEAKQLPLKFIMKCKKDDFAEMRAISEYEPYVMTRLESCVVREDEKSAKCLLYLNYLLKLFSLKQRRNISMELIKSTLKSPPHEILERLVSEFTEVQEEKGIKKYLMPINCKNKLISYICALSLHIESFVVNVKNIAKDLSMSPQKVLDFYRQLGCVVEVENGDKIARLKAPVEFPKPKRSRR